jgi:hypothetical protein
MRNLDHYESKPISTFKTKIVTTYRTVIYCVLVLSVSVNYLTYIGKFDMYAGGLVKEVKEVPKETNWAQELGDTLPNPNYGKSVVLSKKK